MEFKVLSADFSPPSLTSFSKIREKLLPALVAVLIVAFFFIGLLWPLASSIWEAFRTDEQASFFSDFTLSHIFGLFHEDASQWRWMLNSLLLAFIVTFICAAVCYPLAYLQSRTSFPGKVLLGGLLLLPLILPPFVGAIGLRRMLAKYGTVNLWLIDLGLVPEDDPIDFLTGHRMLGCVIVMVLHFYPLLYLNLASAIGSIDHSLIESARSLGLSSWQVFRRVVFPLSIPGLVAGGSLVFVGAFTDLGTPLIFGYDQVIASQIFALANEQSSNPAAPALVFVVTLVVVVLFMITRFVVGRFGKGAFEGAGVKGSSRGVETPLSGWKAWLAVGFYGVVILFSILPHFAVVLGGLADRWVMTAMPESYTTRYLEEALTHDLARFGITNSLYYATASTIIDVLLGLACAWVIVRRPGLWGKILDGLTLVPLAIPGIVLAFGYVGLFSSTYQAAGTWLTVGYFLILGYAVRRLPYTTRACAAGLEQVPRMLEEAGVGLGATKGKVFAKITVPLIMAHIAAGAILAFAFAMLEVSDSLILANRVQDYPLTKSIYELFKRVGDGDQLASALGLFTLVFMTLALLSAGAFLGRKWGEIFKG